MSQEHAAPVRSSRRPVVVAAVAIIVLVVAGVLVVPRILPGRLIAPEKTLRSFFAALSDRDLDAALDLAYSPDEQQADAGVLPDPTDLTFAALDGDGYTPPTGLRITSVTEPDLSEYVDAGQFPDGAQYVATAFTYAIGDQEVDDAALLIREDGRNPYRPWRILLGRAGITVSTEGSGTPAVDGTAMESADGEWTISSLPGAYQVDTGDDAIYTSEPQTATVTLTSADQVSLPQYLRTAVKDQVSQQVRAFLDDCAASSDPAPQGCPFSTALISGVDTDQVDWVIDIYPSLSYAASDQAGELTVSSATGMARARDPQTGETLGSTSFSVTGTATVNGSDVTFGA